MELVPLITPRTHLIFRDHEIAAQRSPPVHPGVWALSGLHTISCVSTYSRLILLTITIQSSIAMFINVLKNIFYSQTMIGKS